MFAVAPHPPYTKNWHSLFVNV